MDASPCGERSLSIGREKVGGGEERETCVTMRGERKDGRASR